MFTLSEQELLKAIQMAVFGSIKHNKNKEVPTVRTNENEFLTDLLLTAVNCMKKCSGGIRKDPVNRMFWSLECETFQLLYYIKW